MTLAPGMGNILAQNNTRKYAGKPVSISSWDVKFYPLYCFLYFLTCFAFLK